MRFGHTGKICKDKNVYCAYCGQKGHDENWCKEDRQKKEEADRPELSCINCMRNQKDGKGRGAKSKECPVRIIQEKVKVIMAWFDKSPGEALVMLDQNNSEIPPRKRTYADRLK